MEPVKKTILKKLITALLTALLIAGGTWFGLSVSESDISTVVNGIADVIQPDVVAPTDVE